MSLARDDQRLRITLPLAQLLFEMYQQSQDSVTKAFAIATKMRYHPSNHCG